MAARTIEQAWLDYRRMVLKPDTTDEQAENVRNVFYAGALAVTMAIDIAAGLNEELGTEMIEGCILEAEEFANSRLAEQSAPKTRMH